MLFGPYSTLGAFGAAIPNAAFGTFPAIGGLAGGIPPFPLAGGIAAPWSVVPSVPGAPGCAPCVPSPISAPFPIPGFPGVPGFPGFCPFCPIPQLFPVI